MSGNVLQARRVADLGMQGEDWDAAELDAIIADYFP
jgi:hypothetical protein